jgi:hypothetical protein
MPHPFFKNREEINALIGPIEELMAKADNLPGYVAGYTIAGLAQALETLEDALVDIENFVEDDDSGVDDPIGYNVDDEDDDEDNEED